jgi:hypothetical protein
MRKDFLVSKLQQAERVIAQQMAWIAAAKENMKDQTDTISILRRELGYLQRPGLIMACWRAIFGCRPKGCR